MNRVTSALAAALLVLAVFAATASAAPPLPRDDPFYAAPDPLPAVAPGTVLRSRVVQPTALGIPIPVTAWQLLYTSTDTKDRPTATVATVIAPVLASKRTLVSYQPAEDGLSTECAPSYTIRAGTEEEQLQMLPLLAAGTTVVVPDYEGPESQWVAGHQAGHAVLDAIRATQTFAPAGLPGRRTPTAIWGYSGGGHATAWAAELHPSYAPELDLRGAAEGGVPADLIASFRNMDGGPASGLPLGAAVGISRAYPEMDMDAVLNEAGREMVRRIGAMCLEEMASSYPFRSLSEFTTVADPFAVGSIKAAMDHNALGRRTPRAPIHLYHALLDELNPYAPASALARTYCAGGAKVQFWTELTGEHLGAAVGGAAAATRFILDRLAGKPAPSNCA